MAKRGTVYRHNNRQHQDWSTSVVVTRRGSGSNLATLCSGLATMETVFPSVSVRSPNIPNKRPFINLFSSKNSSIDGEISTTPLVDILKAVRKGSPALREGMMGVPMVSVICDDQTESGTYTLLLSPEPDVAKELHAQAKEVIGVIMECAGVTGPAIEPSRRFNLHVADIEGGVDAADASHTLYEMIGGILPITVDLLPAAIF